MTKKWTPNEVILVIDSHINGTPLNKVAKAIGRSMSSVSFKASNIKSLDPKCKAKGATNITKTDKWAWDSRLDRNFPAVVKNLRKFYGLD